MIRITVQQGERAVSFESRWHAETARHSLTTELMGKALRFTDKDGKVYIIPTSTVTHIEIEEV